ncbi:plant transposon protein [Nitzschia inconspicua]|uniref:Plant transposon protein n=1 Tax=Nitzschia inconspicua TaxID=303405 RepID=A0A9K3LQL2_9STRA|nr:plant transposon protein [Nitzschia inconspicua]
MIVVNTYRMYMGLTYPRGEGGSQKLFYEQLAEELILNQYDAARRIPRTCNEPADRTGHCPPSINKLDGTPRMGTHANLTPTNRKRKGTDFALQGNCRDIGASEIRFYQKKKNLDVDEQASLEAKILLPIKTLAYGVPPHTFIDYFQMSPEYARECCRQFDIAVKIIYAQEYLRLPTSDDLRSILQLHRHVHQVDGLFGSLDCSHTIWKNCPKAWAGSYTGKPGSPSIILEAVVDYHMFFWHASYGYTGNIGDLNVLAQSPLLERMVDGSFHTLENEASVVPFKIGDQEFTKCFI